MNNFKTFGAIFFVGATLVAYGCDDKESAATPPADDGGTVPESSTNPDGSEAGTCKATQVPADYEKCFTFESQAFPSATPVNTACLPAELASERAKTVAFGELAWGDFVLTAAYDHSADCAQAKTVLETLKYNDIYVTIATSYTARPDGAIGKSTSQWIRLPPAAPAEPEDGGSDADADGDAGTDDAGVPDAGAPSPEMITLPQRSCPPALPEVNCVPIDSWFQGGFYTITETELRVFKNAAGAAPDPSTAQLYAVYKKVQ